MCQEEIRADLLILVGDDRERRAVRERLPQRLHDLAVEAPHGPGSKLLDKDVERARAEHVHRRAADELERFVAARSPDAEGHVGAVEDVPALVEAAREHQISELLIRPVGPDAHREVWIGEAPDQLAVRRTDTKVLGQPNPWPARADDALLRSAVATGAPALSVTVAGPRTLRWAGSERYSAGPRPTAETHAPAHKSVCRGAGATASDFGLPSLRIPRHRVFPDPLRPSLPRADFTFSSARQSLRDVSSGGTSSRGRRRAPCPHPPGDSNCRTSAGETHGRDAVPAGAARRAAAQRRPGQYVSAAGGPLSHALSAPGVSVQTGARS